MRKVFLNGTNREYFNKYDNTLHWGEYYIDICNLEQLLKYIIKLGLADRNKSHTTRFRVHKHRWHYVKRLKNLGVIDDLLYNILNNQEYYMSYGIDIYQLYNDGYILPCTYIKEYKNCRVYSYKLILSCEL